MVASMTLARDFYSNCRLVVGPTEMVVFLSLKSSQRKAR
jgi:hypothetical protein